MPDGGQLTLYGQVVLFCFLISALVKDSTASQSTKTASSGSTQVLDCFVKPNLPESTKLMIEWKKYGVDKKSFTVFLQYDNYPQNINDAYTGRIRLVNRTSLEISHIRASDEGLYECDITYIDGVEDTNNSTWVDLQINAPPKIISSSPSTVRASQEATVELFCRASGKPAPDIIWFKDGVPIANSNRLTIALNKETITIKNLQRSDGGTYGCRFQNMVGQVAQRIDLIVQGAAYILNRPSNMTVLKGQRISFSCGADAFPNNITYRWYFRGRNIRDIIGYGTRITTIKEPGSSSEQLVISPVYETDMGWYTCRPSNGVGEDPQASAFLNVTYPPKVLTDQMPSRVTWALGFQKRLDCPVDANPPVHEVSWTKNSYVMDFSSNRVTQLQNGSLLIYQVEQVDAGSYSCTPISSISSGQSSPLVQVIVQDPPRFIIRPDPHYLRKTGEQVTLPCAASGKPPPEIQWRKVTGTLNATGRIRLDGGNLTITKLMKVDHGKYECEAQNDVARMVVVTELIVQDTTPHAPFNLTATPDWFSVRLSWIPAYNGGSQQFFMIWYRSTNGQTSEWLTMQVVPQDATHFTVYNLQPDTTYQFKIMARNINGDGNFSKVLETKTLGSGSPLPTSLPVDANGKIYYPKITTSYGPRPPPPRNVSVSMVSAGVRITWLPPVSSSVDLSYYVIEVSPSQPSLEWGKLAQLVNISARSYIWTDYEPDTTYFFRIYTYSIVSYSTPSETVTIRTPSVPEDSSFYLSQAQIGGIIGGLLFLLVAVLLAIIGVICSKRKEKHRPEKYGNVKYIGPADEIDTLPDYRTQDSSERSSRNPSGRAGTLARDYIANGIFIVPQTNKIYRDSDMVARDYQAESQLYHPDEYIYNSDRGYRVPYAGGHDSCDPLLGDQGSRPSRSRSRTREDSYKSDREQSLSRWRNRFPDSHFPSSFSVKNSDQSRDAVHFDQSYSPLLPTNGRYPDHSFHQRPCVNQTYPKSYSSYPRNHGDVKKFRSHSDIDKRDFLLPRPPVGDRANGFLPERYNNIPLTRTNSEEDDNDDDENGFLPKRPPLPEEYRKSSTLYPPEHEGPLSYYPGHEEPSLYGPNGSGEPYYENIPLELDDVFVPSFDHQFPSHHALSSHNTKPNFPRHSSMKPSYQTYLTGDPVDDGNNSQPFIANDISSVLPSFTESSINQSRDPTLTYLTDEPTLVNKLEKPNWNIPYDSFRGDQVAPYSSRNLRPQSRSSDSRLRSKSSNGLPLSSFGSFSDTITEPQAASPSDRPSQYTRDHLQGTVDKLRKGPRARRSKSAGRLPASEHIPYQEVMRGPSAPDHTIDRLEFPRSPTVSDHGPVRQAFARGPTVSDSDILPGPYSPYKYASDIEPYKSKRDSRSSMNSSGRGSMPGRTRHVTEPGRIPQYTQDLTPDSLSSGVGSRNNSQATGSSANSRVPYPGNSASIESIITPQEHDFSQDSSPFLDTSARKDTSADDNYEFDSLQALENDLINTLREYPSLGPEDRELMRAIESGLSTSDFYDDLYPKPSRQSCYDDSETRFEKLRQEFHQFQRKQQEWHQQRRLAMDSEML